MEKIIWRLRPKIKYDKIFDECKKCVNYVSGKCRLFEYQKVRTAREYFCHGWYFKKSDAFVKGTNGHFTDVRRRV